MAGDAASPEATPEKEPCFSCAEPVAPAALICPHCRRSVLVDVALPGPVTDGRRRYQAARALAALGPPVPALPALQGALTSSRPVPARGATRELARRVVAALEAQGLDAEVTPAAGGGGLAGVLGKGLAAAALVLALGGAGWWALRRPPASPSEGGPPEAIAEVKGDEVAAPPALTPQALAARTLPSCAALSCTGSLGAGFFVAEDLLLTNAHVLCPGETQIQVALADGRRLTGVPVESDEGLDLGLVRVAGAGVSPLPLGDAGELQVGDRVTFVGSPVGLAFTVHEGTVSNFSSRLGLAYVQLDAKINPGNSGGPLVDARGRVVGVVSLKSIQGEGIGWALPINYAYREGGFLPRPREGGESAGFRELEASAQVAESREAEVVQEAAPEQPGLVGAGLDPYRNLVARVARASQYPPPAEELSFRLLRGDEVLCTMQGDVSEWKAVEGARLSAQVDSQVRQWLERRGLDIQIYEGEATLRWHLCPREKVVPGVVLELEGADPSAARIVLR